MSLLETGRVLAGRFEITGFLGRGGMGDVYRARHIALPLDLAVKVLKPELEAIPSFVHRFQREAVAATLARHPNVVSIFDFGRQEGIGQYLVMEYLEGETLEDRLDRLGRLGLAATLHILIQLTDALDQAHRAGVVHRDLKLENILLCHSRGRKDIVKLVDFGIAELLSESNQGSARRTQVLGTPEYMSPEQAMGLPQDGRSDIYSVGILLYELLTGEPPFMGSPEAVLLHHVRTPPPLLSHALDSYPIPRLLDAIYLRCLAKDPEKRYPTAAHLRRDLLRARAVLAGLAQSLSEQKPDEHPAFQAESPWRPLGSASDEAYVVLADSLPEPDEHLAQTFEGQALRKEYHGLLKELALDLREAGQLPEAASRLLEEIFQLEEEEQALAAQTALWEQSFERIRFEMGEQESMLQYAILDLTIERRQLDESPEGFDAARAADLDYQIGQLKKRLEEVRRERASRIQALNHELQDYRQRLEEKRAALAAAYAALDNELAAKAQEFAASAHGLGYAKLADLKTRLAAARRQVSRKRGQKTESAQ